jgi:phasin family protein
MAQAAKSPQFFENDFMKFMNPAAYAGQFRLPGVNGNALAETQKKNFEALSAANRVAIEGAQAVARRQAEILQSTMEGMSKAIRQISDAGSVEDRMVKQVELAKQGFETSLANLRELAEMTTKSNSEAFEVLNKRIAESLDEFKAALHQVQSKK